MLETREYHLKRHKLLSLLETLAAAGGVARSLYFRPGLPLSEIEGMISKTLETEITPSPAVLIHRSATGGVLYWGEAHKYLLLPPFPFTETGTQIGYRVELLKDLVSADYTVAVIAVRLGSYGIGVFRGSRLVSSKVGTGLVHARHKKGGSSSGRFARHREKQIEGFFTRVGGHLRDKVEPYLNEIDYAVYGGEAQTVTNFRKSCPLTHRLDGRTLNYLLNLREPRQASLIAAIEDVYAARVVHWYEPAGQGDAIVRR
jgi:hypothetical protein